MQISLTPIRQDESLELSVAGDVLTLNGAEVDLSGIPEGATLPREAVDCPWFASDVERVGGALRMTLLLPHGADAPAETLFPAAIEVSGDGPVALPVHAAKEGDDAGN